MIRLALASLALAACGTPALPKGPPPEYEEEPGMAAPAASSAAPTEATTSADAATPAPEHS